MGISIKNRKVEAMLRQFAERHDLGLTEAIERALEIASDVERVEASERVKHDALERFLEAARASTAKSDRPWTREELHER